MITKIKKHPLAGQTLHSSEQIMEIRKNLYGHKLNDKVTVLENKPATESKRRIDGIIDKMLWLIVGGLAAYLFYLATGINL